MMTLSSDSTLRIRFRLVILFIHLKNSINFKVVLKKFKRSLFNYIVTQLCNMMLIEKMSNQYLHMLLFSSDILVLKIMAAVISCLNHIG